MTTPKPKASEGKTAEQDPRHPDTTADREALDPSESAVAAAEPRQVGGLDPAVYGFRAIEVTETDETGPGTVEPQRVEAVSAGKSFAERSQARSGGGNKAVQSGENK